MKEKPTLLAQMKALNKRVEESTKVNIKEEEVEIPTPNDEELEDEEEDEELEDEEDEELEDDLTGAGGRRKSIT